MSAAQQLQAARLDLERIHHCGRIAWLTANAKPKWNCGTPVSLYDQLQMVQASRQWLVEHPEPLP